MRMCPEAFLFAMIVGRKVSLFADLRHPVCTPLQLPLPVLYCVAVLFRRVRRDRPLFFCDGDGDLHAEGGGGEAEKEGAKNKFASARSGERSEMG